MRRFTKILFSPLGQHDNSLAVRNVAKLVVDTSAQLTLFGVIPEPGGLRRLLPGTDIERELRDRQRADLDAELTKWGRRIGRAEVETIVEFGNPAVSIIERVMHDGHDLVVVTSDDQEDQATVKRLQRKCPCPVWVIRPTRARTLRVLAAVNPDAQEVALNHLILELAASMVDLHGGELHVAHAWDLPGEATLRQSPRFRGSRTEIDSLLRNVRTNRERSLDQLLTHPKTADAPWQVHLVKGEPAHVITDLAADLRINLLIMGTTARTGMSGLVMGNIAENILDHVGCSVIALKPPGFVSPIKPAS
ncbi:universal stress protein [Ilumatobacter sp.]|uniref:universal stress protein n=1 Tax=Ilumatobacter sp. TaxID=1967498 RepID=UPI003AF95DD6